MNWRPSECRPGDMIRINLGVLYHYGIFVSEDRVIQFGLPPIPEYRMPANEVEVLATDVDTFACGKIVEVAEFDKKESAAAFPRDQIIARAAARLGEKGYNLLHNNCEHFVYECVFGVKHCSQEEEARRRWNSRPILDVYVARADGADLTGGFFPAERAAEIAACSNERLRRDKTLDWQVLCFGLKRSLALSPESLNFKKRKNGGWQCDGAFFSLSHAGDWVATAVSNRPVGVDLEREGRFASRRSERLPDWTALRRNVYTPEELRASDGETMADFLIKWTRKEAIFKQSGSGRYHPRRIAAEHDRTVTRLLSAPEDGILSVCGDHVRQLRLFLYQNGAIVPLASSSGWKGA